MQAIEFKTKIKNGKIVIPEKFRKKLEENVKVIVLSEEYATEASNIIDDLIKSPLKIKNFQPMTREEIYDRT